MEKGFDDKREISHGTLSALVTSHDKHRRLKSGASEGGPPCMMSGLLAQANRYLANAATGTRVKARINAVRGELTGQKKRRG